VDTNNPKYTSVAGVLFNKNQTILMQYPGGKSGSYSVPMSVTNIDLWAFGGCAGLTDISIPNSVTTIGFSAFDSCTGLTNITVPASITSLGGYALGFCSQLQGVYFRGNAPGADSTLFSGDTATVYYLSATTGWSSLFEGLPAVLWNPAIPMNNASIGVTNNTFGFHIVGTPSIPIVIEACTNLVNSVWTPLLTCNVTNGSIYFSDGQWAALRRRFYRIRSP
jgi:hypothetical protein